METPALKEGDRYLAEQKSNEGVICEIQIGQITPSKEIAKIHCGYGWQWHYVTDILKEYKFIEKL